MIDLDALGLRSGEAERLEIDLEPEAPQLGGEELPIGSTPIATVIDVSRTTSGYALRLRAEVVVGGSWGGEPGPETRFPARMLVDYVAVYRPASSGGR